MLGVLGVLFKVIIPNGLKVITSITFLTKKKKYIYYRHQTIG